MAGLQTAHFTHKQHDRPANNSFHPQTTWQACKDFIHKQHDRPANSSLHPQTTWQACKQLTSPTNNMAGLQTTHFTHKQNGRPAKTSPTNNMTGLQTAQFTLKQHGRPANNSFHPQTTWQACKQLTSPTNNSACYFKPIFNWHCHMNLGNVCRYLHRAINPNDPPAVPQPKPAYPYKTVGCVFNHQTFYANCQVGRHVCSIQMNKHALF